MAWWRALLERLRSGKSDSLGQRGESLAEQYLKRLGHTVLARSWRNAMGELDLVTSDGNTVVFVEVKTRRSTDAGRPDEAVDVRKQQRISRLALAFLKRYGLLERPVRFDVVSITWPETGEPTLEHWQNAFEATGRDSFFT